MIHLAPIGLTMLALAAAAQSGGALVSERTDGARRICGYEDRVRGRLARPVEIAIGLGEPCPFHFPQAQQPRPPEIPPLATLEGRIRENGQAVCRYIYLGTRYSRPVPETMSCPYTPIFSD